MSVLRRNEEVSSSVQEAAERRSKDTAFEGYSGRRVVGARLEWCCQLSRCSRHIYPATGVLIYATPQVTAEYRLGGRTLRLVLETKGSPVRPLDI